MAQEYFSGKMQAIITVLFTPFFMFLFSVFRYYLGDRLLGQGKVWLESAVVEQIGTCFPNRFPQQMLTNLSESEELQQEFHLYRLQQLDKNLEDFEEVTNKILLPLSNTSTQLL